MKRKEGPCSQMSTCQLVCVSHVCSHQSLDNNALSLMTIQLHLRIVRDVPTSQMSNPHQLKAWYRVDPRSILEECRMQKSCLVIELWKLTSVEDQSRHL